MLGNIIVIIVVCIAVFFIIRKIYGVVSGKDPGCGCGPGGCAGCDAVEKGKGPSCGYRKDKIDGSSPN
jgi:hypothetical protein